MMTQHPLADTLLVLTEAEAAYRKAHDLHGDGSREAGRAWDVMRRAGDNARKALSQYEKSDTDDSQRWECANCGGMFGELAEGREPEELCDTCYEQATEKSDTDRDQLREALEDNEELALRIIKRAWQDAGISKVPFFGEAFEPGAVIRSIVQQVGTPAIRTDPVAWACRHETDGDELEWHHPTMPAITPDDERNGWTAEPLYSATAVTAALASKTAIDPVTVERDVRNWFYYPIHMPLNAKGEGPAPFGEIAKDTWEVWDQFTDTFGSFTCLPDAINEAMRLNAIRALGKDQ